MAASNDIFAQLQQIFRKEEVQGAVHTFVLHRFLASDPAYAPVAKELSKIFDDAMVVEIWKSALPKQNRAPYLKYAAPKKTAASGELVKKIADVEGYTLVEAEEVVQMLDQMGLHADLLAHYGIEEKAA